ncbi:MAG: hypothetical protein QM534_00310 [Sediminibacterium sp.]|nr:hypothetical protein [Sediminibacterium sp.]
MILVKQCRYQTLIIFLLGFTSLKLASQEFTQISKKQSTLEIDTGIATLINLKPHVLDRATAQKEQKRFVDNFCAWDSASNTYKYFNDISVTEITENAIIKAKFDKVCNSCRSCPTAIHGIRFLFGLTNRSDSIILICQPVCLKLLKENKDSIQFETIKISNTYFEYNSDNDTFIESNNAERLIYNYKKNIRICKKINCAPYNCIAKDSFNIKKDVNSLIFSLHEIGALLNDNKITGFAVWNAAIHSKKADLSPILHTLILSPSEHDFNKTNIFKGKYANLSHLCPPHCEKLNFLRKRNFNWPQLLIEVLPLLIALFAGFRYSVYKYRTTRLFFIQLIVWIIFFIIAYIVPYCQKQLNIPQNNVIVHNISIFIEMLILLLALKPISSTAFNVIISIITSVTLFEFFSLSQESLHKYSYTIGGILISFLCIYQLFQYVSNKQLGFFRSGQTWILIGLILYFSSMIPYVTIYQYLTNISLNKSSLLYTLTVDMLAALRYILLSVGFWITHKHQSQITNG